MSIAVARAPHSAARIIKRRIALARAECATAVVVVFLIFVPDLACACACGCGVFDVGTSAMFPSGSGATVFLEYDGMNQNRNWSGTSRAPADNNPDKEIRTEFYTAGLQYMFDRSWGAMLQLPYWDRSFKTTDGSGDIADFRHRALGDVRVTGLYTGFSPDLSTGVSFGVKLPTGDYRYANFDRDTQIGTGSTDLLIGAYHLGALGEDGAWSYFAQARYERPVATRDGYRPGDDTNAAIGVSYDAGGVRGLSDVAPVLQLIASERLRDSGAASDPDNSGYTRVLLAPGIKIDVGGVRVYADVEFPVYQRVNGNQLVASHLVKLVVSHGF